MGADAVFFGGSPDDPMLVGNIQTHKPMPGIWSARGEIDELKTILLKTHSLPLIFAGNTGFVQFDPLLVRGKKYLHSYLID